jgi:hypothetical protein
MTSISPTSNFVFAEDITSLFPIWMIWILLALVIRFTASEAGFPDQQSVNAP